MITSCRFLPQMRDSKSNLSDCSMNNRSYIVFSSVSSFYFPLVVTVIMYLAIWRKTKSRTRRFATSHSSTTVCRHENTTELRVSICKSPHFWSDHPVSQDFLQQLLSLCTDARCCRGEMIRCGWVRTRPARPWRASRTWWRRLSAPPLSAPWSPRPSAATTGIATDCRPECRLLLSMRRRAPGARMFSAALVKWSVRACSVRERRAAALTTCSRRERACRCTRRYWGLPCARRCPGQCCSVAPPRRTAPWRASRASGRCPASSPAWRSRPRRARASSRDSPSGCSVRSGALARSAPTALFESTATVRSFPGGAACASCVRRALGAVLCGERAAGAVRPCSVPGTGAAHLARRDVDGLRQLGRQPCHLHLFQQDLPIGHAGSFRPFYTPSLNPVSSTTPHASLIPWRVLITQPNIIHLLQLCRYSLGLKLRKISVFYSTSINTHDNNVLVGRILSEHEK